jgi:hypothetical protein
MSGRTFAQINCGLLKSQKMRSLNHAEKWAYLCTHLTTFSSFSGMFHYPEVMWAHDAGITPDELDAVCSRLQAVGLIEYDTAEEVVRIVGFHRQRPPENASRSISLIGDFQSTITEAAGGSGLMLRCVSEFVVAAMQRAMAWKPNSPEHEKLRDALSPFLKTTFQDEGDDFLDALTAEMNFSSKAVRKELGSMLPPLMDHRDPTLSAPSPDRGPTRDLDETRLRRDLDEDLDEDDTAQNREVFDPQTSMQAEASKMPRNGAGSKGSTQKGGPQPSTKRSRLAEEARLVNASQLGQS